MRVENRKWNNAMMGTSNAWANLPTPMELEVDGEGNNLLVFVNLSRVQNNSRNRNVSFRLVVDGAPIAHVNTGDASHWGYDALSFHGYTRVGNGHVHVEVQYYTQGGTVIWYDNNDGRQERLLTAVRFG